VITGGGTGIGAATARSFAEAGAARIALLGRREQPLLDTQTAIQLAFPGVDVRFAPTDITKKSEVDAIFAKQFGDSKIDVLISNAGSMGPSESVMDAEEHSFLDAIQQTIQGSLLIAQAFLRHAALDAVAINVSSSAAHLNFAPQFAAYSIGKAATIRLWDSLAFGHPEVSVFHTQPGVIDTDLNKQVGGAAAFGFEDDGMPLHHSRSEEIMKLTRM
jgi:NAD(P)-dependent dehydrogenase (short-subunit alcohol dehydrogenase family)